MVVIHSLSIALLLRPLLGTLLGLEVLHKTRRPSDVGLNYRKAIVACASFFASHMMRLRRGCCNMPRTHVPLGPIPRIFRSRGRLRIRSCADITKRVNAAVAASAGCLEADAFRLSMMTFKAVLVLEPRTACLAAPAVLRGHVRVREAGVRCRTRSNLNG